MIKAVTHSLVALVLLSLPALGWAQVNASKKPKELQGVEIKERLGSFVPKHLKFKDEKGRDVTLQDFFTGDRPVLFTMNYSNCPLLCNAQLNGLVMGLKDLQKEMGKDFTLITVSIDPKEGPARARLTKTKYLHDYGKKGGEAGWHFLTGKEKNIKALAKALGFNYRYNPETKEYMHGAAVMVASPKGKLVRYLHGMVYPERNLRMAVLEAGEGKIGTPFEQAIMYCFSWDPDANNYTFTAIWIMRGGCLLMAVGLGIYLVRSWVKSANRKTKNKPWVTT